MQTSLKNTKLSIRNTGTIGKLVQSFRINLDGLQNLPIDRALKIYFHNSQCFNYFEVLIQVFVVVFINPLLKVLPLGRDSVTGDVRLLEGEELAGHSKSELDDLDICSRHTVDVEWTKCWKALSGQFVQNGPNIFQVQDGPYC